jgi:signal peptidase I
MQLLSKITEGLANLSIQSVLMAIGVMMVVLTLSRLFRRDDGMATDWLGENIQVVLSVVVVVFLVIRPFLFQAFYIPSGSMEPTLMGPDIGQGRTIGDRLLVNKLIYRVSDPGRGDIVVFRAPKAAAPDEKEFIKRVVGLPNDTVTVSPERLLVDGKVALRPVGETGSGISFSQGKQPAPRVEGRRASLKVTYQDAPLVVVAEPNPQVHQDQFRVEVNGKVELQNESGQILASPAGEYGADAALEGTIYSVNGETRLAVFQGKSLKYQGPHVEINGKSLDEPYLETTGQEALRYLARGPIKLGPHEYFMMGDNRNNSNDSRVWGSLTRDRVIGRAEVLFWPVDRFRIMHWWLISVLAGILVGYQFLQRMLAPR